MSTFDKTKHTICQIMLKKLINNNVDIETKIRAFPKDEELMVGDFFSGAGTFLRITDTISRAVEHIRQKHNGDEDADPFHVPQLVIVIGCGPIEI